MNAKTARALMQDTSALAGFILAFDAWIETAAKRGDSHVTRSVAKLGANPATLEAVIAHYTDQGFVSRLTIPPERYIRHGVLVDLSTIRDDEKDLLIYWGPLQDMQ